MLTYEKFVSGDSGSRYKYGEKFPYLHTTMRSSESTRVLLYLVLFLPPDVPAGHDCNTETTKFYMEEKLGRDVAWVRHEASGDCSVLFGDSAG